MATTNTQVSVAGLQTQLETKEQLLKTSEETIKSLQSQIVDLRNQLTKIMIESDKTIADLKAKEVDYIRQISALETTNRMVQGTFEDRNAQDFESSYQDLVNSYKKKGIKTNG